MLEYENPAPTYDRKLIHQVIISCAQQIGCGANVLYNDYSLEIAQAKAMERWNRRAQ